MNKELTNIEVSQSATGCKYYKVWFGSQYFLMTPWHYKAANLTKLLNKIPSLTVGNVYDIKWRDARYKTKRITLLTQINEVEQEEFEWLSEEIDNKPSLEAVETPKTNFVKQVEQRHYQQSNDPHNVFDEQWDSDEIPF